jgi:hypothetical protein
MTPTLEHHPGPRFPDLGTISLAPRLADRAVAMAMHPLWDCGVAAHLLVSLGAGDARALRSAAELVARAAPATPDEVSERALRSLRQAADAAERGAHIDLT